jgi:hypothetical protein
MRSKNMMDKNPKENPADISTGVLVIADLKAPSLSRSNCIQIGKN